jgi:hypothetical protein
LNEARRGFLEIGGNSIKDTAMIARFVNGEATEVSKLLSELESFGVFSRDESGVIYSRRIVKDTATREQKRAAGKMGGNPSLLNRVVKHPVVKHPVVKHPDKQGSLNPEIRDQRSEIISREREHSQLSRNPANEPKGFRHARGNARRSERMRRMVLEHSRRPQLDRLSRATDR